MRVAGRAAELARDAHLIAGAPDAAFENVGDTELAGDLRKLLRRAAPPSSVLTRSRNCDVGSPFGNRVHCTARNSAGTLASASRVASITSGSRNAFSSAMVCVRCAASFHSSLK
jgi:hypothetical protein